MAADMAEALMLLTRLPVPVRLTRPRGASASWAWPLAGAAVASLAAAVGAAATATGLPPGLAAGLALAALVLLTGALHEDGLADTADGLWGGQTRDRRLEILRDSRIGTYGVVALVLVLGLRWQALVLLVADPCALATAMVAAAALSRAAMAGVAAALPHARADGLSVSTGRPRAGAVALGALLAAALAVGLVGVAVVGAALAAALAAALIARLALARIGGQTGDILGASQQLAEIAVLIALLALRP
jgi:adenosylcobinamide-GDP ribazoletransferase